MPKRYGVFQIYDRLRERQERERKLAQWYDTHDAITEQPIDPGRCFIIPGVHEYGCELYDEELWRRAHD